MPPVGCGAAEHKVLARGSTTPRHAPFAKKER